MGDPLEQISYGADGCSCYFFLADRAELPYRRFDRAGFSNGDADNHRYTHCHRAPNVYARAPNGYSNRYSATSSYSGSAVGNGSTGCADSLANAAPGHACAHRLSFACTASTFGDA